MTKLTRLEVDHYNNNVSKTMETKLRAKWLELMKMLHHENCDSYTDCICWCCYGQGEHPTFIDYALMTIGYILVKDPSASKEGEETIEPATAYWSQIKALRSISRQMDMLFHCVSALNETDPLRERGKKAFNLITKIFTIIYEAKFIVDDEAIL